MIENWKCDVCGLELRNVVEPVRHNCKPRGVGDTVAKLTKAVGLKPCGKCKKRQEALNKAFPYKDKK